VENSIYKMLWNCCNTNCEMDKEVRAVDRREWVPVLRVAKAKLNP